MVAIIHHNFDAV